MIRSTISKLVLTVVAGCLVGSTAMAQGFPQPITQAAWDNHTVCTDQSGNCQTSGNPGCPPGVNCQQYAGAPNANCWGNQCSGYPNGMTGWSNTSANIKHVPAVKWLVDPDYYKYSPDHGWAKISKRPILRRGIGYQHYWPQHWYGTPQNAAMRAQAKRYPIHPNPTDTMQQGYYYQQVPQWLPNPRMLPADPVPSQYHIRNCWVGADGGHNVYVPMGQGTRGGNNADMKVDANGNRYYDVWVPLNKGKKDQPAKPAVPAPAPAPAPDPAPAVQPPAPPAPAPAAQPPKPNTASLFDKFNPKYLLTGGQK